MAVRREIYTTGDSLTTVQISLWDVKIFVANIFFLTTIYYILRRGGMW